MKVSSGLKRVGVIVFFLYILIYYMYGYFGETIKYSEMILIVFLGIEGALILINKKIKFNFIIIVSFIFSFYCFMSNYWAIDSEIAIAKAKTLVVLSIFLLLVYNFFSNIDNSEEILLRTIMYVGLFFSFYVVMYYGVKGYFSRLLSGERMGQEINNVNALGMQIVIPIIIMLSYILSDKKKWYYSLYMVIPTIVALGTGSREVIVALVGGIFFIFLFIENETTVKYRKLRKFFVFLIVFISIIYIVQMPIFSSVFQRFMSMLNLVSRKGKVDGSINIRNIFIKEGFKQFLKKPVLGIGVGNSGYITIIFWHNHFTYLHNNFIELLVCTGIIGFLIYYSMHLYIILNCIRLLKYKSRYIYITLIIFLVNLLLDYGTVSYTDKTIYIYLVIGIIIVEKERKRLKERDEKIKKNIK